MTEKAKIGTSKSWECAEANIKTIPFMLEPCLPGCSSEKCIRAWKEKRKGGEGKKTREKNQISTSVFLFFFLLGNVTGLYEKQGRKTSLLLTTVNLEFLI